MNERDFIENYKKRLAENPTLAGDPALQATMVDICAHSLFLPVEPLTEISGRMKVLLHFVRECEDHYQKQAHNAFQDPQKIQAAQDKHYTAIHLFMRNIFENTENGSADTPDPIPGPQNSI